VFELGIANSFALMIYSICIFFSAIFFGVGLLFSGKYANFKKRKHEFFMERISMLQAEEQDKATREKQDRDYKEKIRLAEQFKAQQAEEKKQLNI